MEIVSTHLELGIFLLIFYQCSLQINKNAKVKDFFGIYVMLIVNLY